MLTARAAPAVDEGRQGRGSRSAVPVFRDVRIPHAAKLMLALCAIAFGGILYASRQLDFYYDEWSFVDSAAHWSLGDYFVPHNEHWSTVPMVIYRLLLATAGMRSYLPYLLVLLVLHVSAAFLLFLIVRRRCGDLLALCAGCVLLFFGRGYEDLIWAFQVGFLGSVAFGLLALYLLGDRSDLSRRRAAGSSAALLLALMSSGMGLFFLIAIAVQLGLGRERQRLMWVPTVPGLTYVWWYLAFGRQGTASDHSIFTLKTLIGLASYVPVGVGTATAGVFALSASWAVVALILLVVTVALLWYRRRRDFGLSVAAAVALLAQYTLIGAVREQYGLVEATSSRYIYIGAVFVLLILTEALRGVRWRGVWRTVAPITAIAVVAAGAGVLVHQAQLRTEMLSAQKYELEITWLLRDAPGLDHDVVIDQQLLPVVTPSLYIASRERYGSPLPGLKLSELAKLPTEVINNELRVLMPTRVSQTAGSPPTAQCSTPVPPGGQSDVAVPGGSQASIKASGAPSPSHVVLSTWYRGEAPDGGDQHSTAPAGRDLHVTVPDTGLGLNWHVRIKNVGPGPVTVCLGHGAAARH